MKRSIMSWLLPILAATAVSARDAQVLVSGGLSVSSIPPVSPLTARLLIAQILGVSEYHNLDGVDDSSLLALNELRKDRIGDIVETTPTLEHKTFIIVEGVEDIQEFLPIVPEASKSTFVVKDAPLSSEHVDLIRSFEDQAVWSAVRPLRNRRFNFTDLTQQHQDCIHALSPPVDLLNNEVMAILPIGDYSFGYSTVLDMIHHALGPSSVEYTTVRAKLKQQIADFLAANRGSIATIYVLPPCPPEPRSLFKRIVTYGSSGQPWGVLPRQEDNVSPFGSALSFGAGKPDMNPSALKLAETNPKPAPQPQEVQDDWTISHDQDPDFGPPPFSPARVEQSYPAAQPNRQGNGPSTQQQHTSPAYGTLRSCYSSQDDCEEQTQSCSGHGSCRQKTNAASTCYACFCESTVEELPDGRRSTTKWSGQVCQKQDISMPFWLLGGASVGLVSVVAWGVALLYAMGQEELPSVIGAGVAGVRPGK